MINSSFLCVVMVLMTTSLGAQQEQKRRLNEKDYGLWSRLALQKVSDGGRWLSYSTYYEDGIDTTFVINTVTSRTFQFPVASRSDFWGDTLYAVMDKQNNLDIVDLFNGSKKRYAGVHRYTIPADSRYIFIEQKEEATNSLLVLSRQGRLLLSLTDIKSYSYNEQSGKLAFCRSVGKTNILGLADVRRLTNKQVMVIDSSSKYTYTQFVWQRTGKAFVFMEEVVCSTDDVVDRVGFFQLEPAILRQFDKEDYPAFPADRKPVHSSFIPLSISDDGQRVFFGVSKSQVEEPDAKKVQIWNTYDRFLYPAKVEINGWDPVPKIGVWWPAEKRFYTPAHKYPHVMLTGDQKAILTYDIAQYEPQARYNPPEDVWLTELETGKKTLILEKFDDVSLHLYPSPGGRYISYFKNGHWWLYEIRSQIHRDLTEKIPGIFFQEGNDTSSCGPAYGIAGWSADDRYIYIYDRYDLWECTADGRKFHRLTSGREIKTVFRIIQNGGEVVRKMNFHGVSSPVISFSQPIFWEGKMAEKNGFYKSLPGKEMMSVAEESAYLSQPVWDKSGNTFAYCSELYDNPPKIQLRLPGRRQTTTLVKTNLQQQLYEWGRAECIKYQNSEGTELSGILYYPAAYKADSSYPMIVHVYEKQSQQLYHYINPSVHNDLGFNISNMLAQGYFVLLPDIIYKIGAPGASALNCTTAAIDKVLSVARIDSLRIGLIGHSWGGYETAYIIANSQRFKAAVAGAPVTDFKSDYFSISGNENKPNFFMAEFEQLRIGAPFFKAQDLYRKNSPLESADRITTPLLSWAGEMDKRVSPEQSIALHLALRRLALFNIMLLYPGQRHVIRDRTYQKDLTAKIEEWFAYYLKGEDRPGWMEVDMLE